MEIGAILFWILALLTGGCAVAVVLTQNIVRAATWLLFTLAGTAGVFFLLGADFVGSTQLLVYVGGTLVLVIFGVMLTAQGPFIHMRVSAAEWAVALFVGLLLYGALAASLVARPPLPDATPGPMPGSAALGEAFLGSTQVTAAATLSGIVEPPMPADFKVTAPLAPRERTKSAYVFPFEIVSVHLLVVLIGAAYLARTKRRRQAAGPGALP
jgi:NADH-quinone oxidoreductase subunit J